MVCNDGFAVVDGGVGGGGGANIDGGRNEQNERMKNDHKPMMANLSFWG